MMFTLADAMVGYFFAGQPAIVTGVVRVPFRVAVIFLVLWWCARYGLPLASRVLPHVAYVFLHAVWYVLLAVETVLHRKKPGIGDTDDAHTFGDLTEELLLFSHRVITWLARWLPMTRRVPLRALGATSLFLTVLLSFAG